MFSHDVDQIEEQKGGMNPRKLFYWKLYYVACIIIVQSISLLGFIVSMTKSKLMLDLNNHIDVI